MRRPALSLAAALAAVALAACGAADDGADAPTAPATATEPAGDATDDTVTPTPTATDTQAPQPGQSMPTDPATGASPPGPADEPTAPADGDPVAPVTLAFDGREVPVAHACNGVDGAILATTQGEVTIQLIREQGLAMRYVAEGFTAETTEVATTGGTDATTFTATLSSDEVDPPVRVEMTVLDDARAALEDCRA